MTDTNSANCPTPILEGLRDKLIAYCPELGTEKLYASFLKRLCGGGDAIASRGLYQPTITDFEANAKIFIGSNYYPNFDIIDQSLQNRMFKIVFPIRFVKFPKASNEKQIIENLGEAINKDKAICKQFMSIILKAYGNLWKNRFHFNICEKFQMTNDDIQGNIDVEDFLSFVTQRFIVEPNSVVTVTDILNLYKPGHGITEQTMLFHKLRDELKQLFENNPAYKDIVVFGHFRTYDDPSKPNQKKRGWKNVKYRMDCSSLIEDQNNIPSNNLATLANSIIDKSISDFITFETPPHNFEKDSGSGNAQDIQMFRENASSSYQKATDTTFQARSEGTDDYITSQLTPNKKDVQYDEIQETEEIEMNWYL
ncbi:hypothetical protein RF11_00018 [Thelohanellus kitauei]|uniref:Uncharacterized protein n=1 Tax=Thelohanellus kitauei TaxID=669202 RepID=A0A0C2J895_THEKT|nr:hypothetical protein RF11_00018 [Thelohanellus kitauei]